MIATCQKLCAEFKYSRFHQFQLENQKKLRHYMSTKLTCQAPEGTATTDLTPSPPPMNTYRSNIVSGRFRRRLEEKEFLKAQNKPMYDFDPEDSDEERDLCAMMQQQAMEEDENDDDQELPGSGSEDSAAEQTAIMGRRRKSQSVTSRQISIHLRRLSSQRSSAHGVLNLREHRKTAIRSTVLELFKNRTIDVGTAGGAPPHGVEAARSSIDLTDRNNEFVRASASAKFMKPNGPISSDVLWRQRALCGSKKAKLSSSTVALASSSPIKPIQNTSTAGMTVIVELEEKVPVEDFVGIPQKSSLES